MLNKISVLNMFKKTIICGSYWFANCYRNSFANRKDIFPRQGSSFYTKEVKHFWYVYSVVEELFFLDLNTDSKVT